MPAVKRIDHIAIVVDDIEKALGFWRDALGLELDHIEDVPDQKSLVAFLPTGQSEVELVKPTTDDSGVARYLQKRGPGIHHICFEVEDIDAALVELNAKGVRLINPTPLEGSGGKRLAFVHPESTFGVLVELYELARTAEEPQAQPEPESEAASASTSRPNSLVERVLLGGLTVGFAALSLLRAVRPALNGEAREESQALREIEI